MHQTLNIWQGCRPERICMTMFTHRHSVPYCDWQISVLVKLVYLFQELVALYTLLTATTCFIPDCGSPRRARGCEGPFNAACGFNYYYFCGKTKGFLRPWTYSIPHQTLHKNQSRWKIWYFIVFATGRGQMAPQRPLEVVKNSCKISGLTDSHEIWDACRACQDDQICALGLLCQIDRKLAISRWSLKKWPFLAISGIGI